MKTLLIMRHAKSSHKEEGLDDFDRPLNDRGRRDAPRMGQLLAAEDLRPDIIVASSAQRTRKTAEMVARECGFREDIRLLDELYEAGPEQMLAVVRNLPHDAARVLLVGHNPGLERFLEMLTGSFRPLVTSAVVQLELSIDDWRQAGGNNSAISANHWQPRELA